MTKTHLQKLFGAFGLILLVVMVNTWLASQGGKAILKIPLLHEERPSMAFLALIVGSVMLTATSSVALLHARRYGTSWHARIPTVWLEDLDTSTIEGRWYQGAVLLLLVGVPIASFVHFVAIVAGAKLCESGAAVQRPVSEAWFSGIPNAKDQIRLVDDLAAVQTVGGTITRKCAGGIQVFPGWEFLLVGAALAVSLTITVALLYAVFLAASKQAVEPEVWPP